MKFVISLVVLALAAAVTANPVDNNEVKEAAVQGAGEAGLGYFSGTASGWAAGLAKVQESIEDMGFAATDLGVIEGQLKALSDAAPTVALGETTIEGAVDITGLGFTGKHE